MLKTMVLNCSPACASSKKNLDSAFSAQYNSIMKVMTQKRLALLFATLFVFLAVVPAIYANEDESLRRDGPYSKVYGHVFALENALFVFDSGLIWSRNTSPRSGVGDAPAVQVSSPETRAPPR